MIEWYHLGLIYGDVIFRRDGYICLHWYSSCIACPSEVDPHREAVFAWKKDIQNAVVWEELSRLKLLIATYICFLYYPRVINHGRVSTYKNLGVY